MENTLYNRLKDEYVDILNTQKEKYPTTVGTMEDVLKSKEFFVNLTLGEAGDLKLFLKLNSLDDVWKVFD